MKELLRMQLGRRLLHCQEEVKVMKSEQKKLREVVGNLEKENKKLLEQLTLLDRNLD